jgi:putative transposase
MKNTKMYAGYRYPAQIISHAVWLYHRFTLSFRDVEELLAARGISVSYETVRIWCIKFGNQYCNQIKKNRGQLGDTWYLDEVFVKINGALHYLWRAVDQDGDELDILVQKRRNKKAAMKFFKKLLKGQQTTPLKIVTDKLRSYSAAKREIMPSVDHSTQQYENNRCELSHQPGRQQERQMRRFKSQGQAQRFLSCHGIVNNLFRLGRHMLKAKNYRTFRDRAFNEWTRVSCVQTLA